MWLKRNTIVLGSTKYMEQNMRNIFVWLHKVRYKAEHKPQILLIFYGLYRFQVGKSTKMKVDYGLSGTRTQNRSVYFLIRN